MVCPSSAALKVGIYSELTERAALGGREFIVAVLAEAFRERGDSVEYVHHLPDLTAQDFEDRFGIARGSIQLRLLRPHGKATMRNFLRWRREHRAWQRSLSSGYDLFICIAHHVPVRSFSHMGVLMVLFPFFEPYNIRGSSRLTGAGLARLRGAARTVYLRSEWQGALATYALRTSISEYTRIWTQRRWKIDSTVIFPPGDSSFRVGEKRNLILSVGRFSGFQIATLSKRQIELMRAFREMDSVWEYASIGAVGNRPGDREYFEEVTALAQGARMPAQVVANAPRALVKELHESAKIFWHAAGFADDDQMHPELMEHFGIATVDAMAAGAVPVVINKGAQPEIVEHGVSGFLWNTIDELKSYTSALMGDEALRIRMAAAAQVRAQHFSRAAFLRRFFEFLQPASGRA